ncbi:MAG: hypothetical protein LBV30_09225 [Propionibacteriaceae bacterium]|jgi:hypothetical protein|nr:hypothetical protein [Propionibacteriaceae bacterium]
MSEVTSAVPISGDGEVDRLVARIASGLDRPPDEQLEDLQAAGAAVEAFLRRDNDQT